MQKNPGLNEEIKALSEEFGIPIQKIRDLLEVGVPKKPKAEKTVLLKKDKTSDEIVLNFGDFEECYVDAKNEEEEISAIRKFLHVCKTAKEAKSLYDLCPETEDELRDMIIHEWIVLSKDLDELLEPKGKVKKNTPDSELAFKQYMKFYF